MASPFDILGIDPDADEEAIKQAYRQRAKETHPDQGGSVEEFQRVKAAYEQLKSGSWDEIEVESGWSAEPEQRASGEADRAGETQPEQTGARVEYLNYEVLDDHGCALEDDDLFEKASDADLDPEDYGRFYAQPDETLLQAAENRGFAWPYACRGGACANCAVVVVTGELTTPVDHILPTEMIERDIRLSCVGNPITDELQVIYNVKHLPDLDDLRLPAYRFERANVSE